MRNAKPQQHGFDPQRLDLIRVWMQRYVDQKKFPGASILIARGDDIIYHERAGLRDIKAGLSYERNSIVRLYSMTKPVTATAIMMLAEKGLFHLDTPLSEFLPTFKNMQALRPGATAIDQVEPCPTPTLHHLLTHTSGLSYAFNPGLLPKAMEAAGINFKSESKSLAQVVDDVAGLPLAFHPGRKWEYSVASDVLGRVVEVVSGQGLAEFFQDSIFAPLAMRDTGFSVPPKQLGRFAALYTPLAGDPMALNSTDKGADSLRLIDQNDTSPFCRETSFSGGGGLVGTLDDYMRFAETLRRGGSFHNVRLLSPRTVDFMMRNHLPGDIASMGPDSFAEQPMDGIGFGLAGSVVLDPARARVPGSIGDFSWGGMASTFFWVDRSLDLTVVFFTQLSPSSAYPSRAELKALVHGAMTS